MSYPEYRPRRLRSSETIRRMVRETKLSPDDFVYPLFVAHGKGVRKEIGSMPGNYQQSIDNLVKDCEEVLSLGIPSVILFGIPEHKDEVGSEGIRCRRHRPEGHQVDQGQDAGPYRHHRRLPLSSTSPTSSSRRTPTRCRRW